MRVITDGRKTVTLCNGNAQLKKNKTEKLNQLVGKYQFNHKQAILFYQLSQKDRHALLTWCMQGRSWTNAGVNLPAECYIAITAYLVDFSVREAIDFYCKIAFFYCKELLIAELNTISQVSFSHFNIFSSHRQKAANLLPLCKEKDNREEMVDILERQKKGDFYAEHLERHHTRLLSI